MIIKKYLANSTEEALQRVKQELGPDHMVLTTRAVQKQGLFGWLSAAKVEVTAAVDEGDLRRYNEAKLKNNLPRADRKEHRIDELNRNLVELKQMVNQDQLPQKPAPIQTNTASVASEPLMQTPGTYGDPRLRRSQAAPATHTSAPATREAPPATGNTVKSAVDDVTHARDGLMQKFGHMVKSEAPAPSRQPEPAPLTTMAPSQGVDQLRSVIREEMIRAQKSVSVGSLENNDDETVGSVRFLVGKGVGRRHALAIERRLNDKYGTADLSQPGPERALRLNALKEELAACVTTTGPITLQAGETTFVALVGPTGVGKTTTLAKIAAEYGNKLNKKVGIISVDTIKLGAREQIKALTDSLGLPLQVATSAQEMHAAMQRFQGFDLVLVDTAGRSQYRGTEVESLAHLLESDRRIQVYLTIAATAKDVDIFGTIKQFSRMPIRGLIFTKLDETIAYGMMVTVCDKTGLPISYLTNGQQVPDDLKIAESQDIARNILLQHNGAEAESLRRMVGA